MITAQTRGLFMTHREAEKRQQKEHRLSKSEAGARSASPTDVLVDPIEVLGIAQHGVRHLTELHFASRGMTRLHASFSTFVNLEELWLTGNRLKRVEGLLPPPHDKDLADGQRGCARLKRLYLSDNAISTIDGDIPRLKYLEVLLLANNKLSNLENVSKKLAPLRFLKQLDLFGNPLAEEQNYRLYVIFQHPQITLLDRQTVSLEERREAADLFGKLGKGFSGTGASVASQSTSSQMGAAKPNTAPFDTRRSTGVAFGSAVPYKEPMEPVGPVSASAKLVEAKVKQLHMQRRAAEELEKAAAERAEHARAEKRRLFHSLWTMNAPAQPSGGQVPGGVLKAGVGASPAQVAAASYTPDPAAAKSKLYDLDDEDSAVARLIELARQREIATTAARRAEIDAQIAKAKHSLFPDRFGDNFQVAFSAAKTASKSAVEQEYTNSLLKTIFTTSEMDALTRLYKTNPLNTTDAVALLKMIQGGEAINATAWGNFFAAAAKGEPGQTMALRATLRRLCDFPEFLAVRESLGYSDSQSAVVRGSGASAAHAFRVVSAIADHRRRLEAASEGPKLGYAFETLRAKSGGNLALNRGDSDDD